MFNLSQHSHLPKGSRKCDKISPVAPLLSHYVAQFLRAKRRPKQKTDQTFAGEPLLLFLLFSYPDFKDVPF